MQHHRRHPATLRPTAPDARSGAFASARRAFGTHGSSASSYASWCLKSATLSRGAEDKVVARVTEDDSRHLADIRVPRSLLELGLHLTGAERAEIATILE